MAARRMFSLKVVDSDLFLSLPIQAQLLYFHLVMRADDEGVVDNSLKIIKIVGCRKLHLSNLIESGFILKLSKNLIVITHWNLQNKVRSDRKTPSVYVNEISNLKVVGGVFCVRNDKENSKIAGKKVSKSNEKSTKNYQNCESENSQEPHNGGQNNDISLNKMTDILPHRVGKDRLGQFSQGEFRVEKESLPMAKEDVFALPKNEELLIEKGEEKESNLTLQNQIGFDSQFDILTLGEFGNVMLSESQYQKISQITDLADDLIADLDLYIESSGKKYKSHYATLKTWVKKIPVRESAYDRKLIMSKFNRFDD